MKVNELIEQLKLFDGDTQVRIWADHYQVSAIACGVRQQLIWEGEEDEDVEDVIYKDDWTKEELLEYGTVTIVEIVG